MPVTHHPPLPKEEIVENPEIKTFRLTNITQMQQQLEQDLSKYSKTKRRYSAAFNVVTYVNTGASTISALTAGTSVGLLATGLGAPTALPLGCVSITLGACSLAVGVAGKKLKAKLQKHTAMVQLITAKLSSFRLIINKALADSNITDEEFNRLQADFDDYKRQKFDLQRKSRTTFSQQPDTNQIREECLKKVNETLNSVLKSSP